MLVLGFGFGMMSCQTRGHGMQSSEAKRSLVEATVVGKPVNKKEKEMRPGGSTASSVAAQRLVGEAE